MDWNFNLVVKNLLIKAGSAIHDVEIKNTEFKFYVRQVSKKLNKILT
jgi:hypothetical protein